MHMYEPEGLGSIISVCPVIRVLPKSEMMSPIFFCWLLCLAMTCGLADAMEDLSFENEQDIMLKVNALTSIHTQVPLDYYSMPVCLEASGPRMRTQSVGEFLTGTKLQSSPYKINAVVDNTCAKLCQRRLNEAQASKLQRLIQQGYHSNWELGDMPSAAIGIHDRRFGGGFPIGFVDPLDEETTYIYNHVNIEVLFQPHHDKYRIVQFAVEPLSVKHSYIDPEYNWDDGSEEGLLKPLATCDRSRSLTRSSILKNQVVKPDERVLYTYSVNWKLSRGASSWSNRWESYLRNNHIVPYKVHWHSIVNSFAVLLRLLGGTARILITNLRQKKEEDKKWKLLHGDVFRSPPNPTLLCAFLGLGMQLAVTVTVVLILTIWGVVNQAQRGAILEAALIVYAIAGVVAGYESSRMHKALVEAPCEVERVQCTRMTAFLLLVIAFATFLGLQFWLCSVESTACVPLLDMLLLFLWGCIQVPLVYLGASIGYRKQEESDTFPTRTVTTPRPIPKANFSPLLMVGLAGLVPSSVFYVEFYFLMATVWFYQYYSTFGIALITLLIAIGNTAMTTIILVYRQLLDENHEWWWFSFLTGGSFGIWTLAFSMLWFTQMEAMLAMTHVLFFAYMILISFGVFLMFGTLSFLSALWFVKKLYSTIHEDTSESTRPNELTQP